MVGTGGAGSAIVDTLCEGGIARLALRGPSIPSVCVAQAVFGAAFPAVELLESYEDLGGFDLIVNASPVGMGDTGELPIPEAMLETLAPRCAGRGRRDKAGDDAVLLAAEARGCRVQTGPEMAAGQIEILGKFMGVLT